MKILLVDDDQDDIDLFTEVLTEIDKSKTVTLWTAHNGIEALKVLSSHLESLPDIIFLDINMPLLNGLDTLEMIRKDKRLKDIDVTIYTTSSHFKDYNKCLGLGAKFWRKPTTTLDLSNRLSELICA
jgi:CheY-like chemotaxis protein